MQVYCAEGLRAVKIGEEALVDLPSFDITRLGKKVRRAARAVATHGVEIQIGTMASLEADIVEQCHAVSAAWLRTHGGMEQGFSMTSGSLPTAGDQAHRVVAGVLRQPDGSQYLLGFLTLAPVPAGGGLSLDHMRRRPEAPNGLMEALIIRAAEHFRDQGATSLSLNFAVCSDKECPEDAGTAHARGAFRPFRRCSVPSYALSVPVQQEVRAGLVKPLSCVWQAGKPGLRYVCHRACRDLHAIPATAAFPHRAGNRHQLLTILPACAQGTLYLRG